MADSFAVHLGGGRYLDASGNLVFGPPTGAQIYESPGGFKLDLKQIGEVFKELSGLLPADEAGAKKWADWGVRGPVLKFLSDISGVVGIVATAIAVYAWALKVLIDIMDLMAKDDGMSDQLKKTLFGIKDQLQSGEEIERADHMIGIHSQFDGRIDKVYKKLIDLAVAKPTGVARAQAFADMLDIVDELAVPLSNLRNQVWVTTYNADAYKSRAFASGLLVTVRADGTLAPVPQQAPGLSVFDYRLGVPMLLYGAVTFTALLQVAMPWFRSAGSYSLPLRKTADALDRFVLQMQTECLARTEYTDAKVLGQQISPVVDLMAPPGPSWGWANGTNGYAVGAFDLVSYNDAFLGHRWIEQFAAGADTGQRGLFNYHWHTTATTLQDIADEANKQAGRDYCHMQAATGTFQLIKTAAWLRCLSTPPARSQTVSGYAAESRVFKEEKPTTATSPPMKPVNQVISKPATLNRYDARNRIRVMTQEPGYKPAFRYRIVLRTLDCANPKKGWINQNYVGDIWTAGYQPTQGDPRCKRLKTKVTHNLILHEAVLYEGPSPAQTVTRGGVARLRATTFDWYVPTGPAFSTYLEPEKVIAHGTAKSVEKKKPFGTGGVSIHLLSSNTVAPPPMQVMDAPSPWVPPFELMTHPSPLGNAMVAELSDVADVIAPSEIALDKAERRHVSIEYVELTWQLSWTAEKLEINLTGRPDNRPFQAHLVIEEAVYSGETLPDTPSDILSDQQLVEWLHTPFAAEIVNQLVMVPEEFFTQERAALVDGKNVVDEMERKYAQNAPVGPADPIVSLHKAIRELTARSSSTATLAATLDLRAEFAASQAPELWNEILRQHEAKSDSPRD